MEARITRLEATTEHIQSGVQDLRQEVKGLGQEVKGLRQEMNEEMKGLRQEFRQEMKDVRQEIKNLDDKLSAKIGEIRKALDSMNIGRVWDRVWMLLAMGTLLGVMARGFKWI